MFFILKFANWDTFYIQYCFLTEKVRVLPHDEKQTFEHV